jgi:hypothetical protein
MDRHKKDYDEKRLKSDKWDAEKRDGLIDNFISLISDEVNPPATTADEEAVV